VTKEDGGFTSMGGRLPKPELTVQDVADLVGRDRMVDVIGKAAAGGVDMRSSEMSFPTETLFGRVLQTSPLSRPPSGPLGSGQTTSSHHRHRLQVTKATHLMETR
jgi:hypothetical protein